MYVLNARQERFIQNIVSGMTQRQAYKEAYKVNYDEDAIDNNASKLFNKAEVQTRYKELMQELEDEAVMTAIEKRKMLKEMALDANNSVTDRIKAIDTDNKMTGEYVTNIKGSLNLTYEEALKKVSDPDEY